MMKSKRLLSLMLLCFALFGVARAQETLTVHNGTATSGYVPVYGYYADAYLKCEMVYPAAELADMENSTITSMTFYASQSSVNWGDASFQVFLTEVDNASISAFAGPGTVVYEGALSISGSQMVVTFTTPYVYNGGNLLVGVYNTEEGTYVTSTWYGESVTGASYTGYSYTSLEAIASGYQRNFLPKTTFEYIPAGGITCERPTNVAVDYQGGSTATVTWDGTASLYNVDVNGVVDYDVTLDPNGYPFTVQPNTTYTVKVQANCGNGELSGWASAESFTTPCAAFALPYEYGFEDPDDMSCWMVVGSTSSSTGITSAGDAAEGSYDFRFHYSERSAYLISPVFAGTENGLNVSFQYMNYSATTSYTEEFQVGYTTNAGETDPANFTYGDVIYGENSWNTYENAFPANTKRIAIKYIYTDAFYLRLDDFIFEAPPTCPKPRGLVAGTPAARSVVLNWTEPGDARDWQICLNGDESNLIPADTNEDFLLEGLTPDTDYTIKVRSYCSEDDQSDWSNEVTIHTDVTCPAPTNLTVSGLTPFAANVAWDGTASNFNMRYKEIDASQYAIVTLRTDDVWGDGTGYQLLLDADATAYGTIIPETGGLTSSGDASAETYAEFEYKIPMNADGAMTTTNMVMNSSVSILIPAGTYDFCITNPTPDDRIWIASANGTLGGGRQDDYVFEAGKAYEFYSYDDPNSTNDATDVTIVDFFGVDEGWSTPVAATSPLAFTELNPETGYAVEIQAACGDEDGESAWVPVYFVTPSNCLAPFNLSETDVRATSAILNWEGYQDGFQVRYRTVEHTGATEGSFYEDFENNTNLTGWTVIRNDEGTNYTDWHVVNSENLFSSGPIPAHSGSYVVMGRSWNSDAYSVDNWLITPQVTLDGQLSYWVMDDGQYHENCDVYVSTTTTDISAFTLLADPEDATDEWTERTVDLSSFNGQLGYIAFRLTDYNQDFLFIDDVLIGSMETVPAGEWQLGTTDQLFFNTNDNPDYPLIPDTDYEWQVRGENRSCGDEGYTEWSVINTFHTPNECELPTDLYATGITANSVDSLTWTGVQQDFNLRYRTAAFDGYYLNEDFEDGRFDYGWGAYNWDEEYTGLYYGDEDQTNIIFMMVAAGGTTGQALFTPDFRAEAAGNTLTFDYAGYYNDTPETFSVGFAIDSIVWDDITTSDSLWHTYTTVIPEGAQYMVIFYEDGFALQLDNFLCYNADDIVAAGEWIETLQGVNSPVAITGLDPETYYEWQVQGNSDGCTDGVTDWVSSEFKTLESEGQTIALVAGTNWFSTYLDIELGDLQAALNAALPDVNSGITIKAKVGNSTLRNGNWRSTNNFVWDVAKMYRIEVPADCEITLTGDPINPADNPITILAGEATWIGFPFSESMDPADVIPAGFAINGDVIKGKEGNFRYTNRWRPTGINALEPGKGYMYVPSSNAGERTLVYTTGSKKASQTIEFGPKKNATSMSLSPKMMQKAFNQSKTTEKVVTKKVKKNNEDCKSRIK